MGIIYTGIIYLLRILCNFLSLFDTKIRKMCVGQRKTYDILRALPDNGKRVWFHCASLGEFEQARNLIEHIKKNYNDCQIILTFFSPSGYEVRKNYEFADCVVYLPFDTPANAKKFISLAKPQAVFFIKYEFWWNYIIQLKNIPLFSVSLILRQTHYLCKPYSKWFVKQLRNFDMFFVQNNDTKEILEKLHYDNIVIAGDTRFDRVYSMSKETKDFPLIKKFTEQKRVFLAGSSWPEDEFIIHEALYGKRDMKIILAPHNIDGKHIAHLLDMFENSVTLSSLDADKCSEYDVLIIDNIGMLMYLYSMCDIAYIGGGFGAGIHNILEAAVFNKPVMFGPNNRKFKEAADLLSLGVAKQITCADDIRKRTDVLLDNKQQYARLSLLCHNYIEENLGATARIVKYTEKYL